MKDTRFTHGEVVAVFQSDGGQFPVCALLAGPSEDQIVTTRAAHVALVHVQRAQVLAVHEVEKPAA